LKPMVGNAWFYIRDHHQQGPVGLFELKKMFEQGVLSGETFIWAKEMKCWQMAKSHPYFSEDFFLLDYADQPQENLVGRWKEQQKDTFPNGRPFVRYIARLFDLSLFSLFLITLVSIFSPKFVVTSSPILIFILSLILYILVEAIILSIFGNTLGKSILNARIKTVTGEPINFIMALKRSILVTAVGMGFGIPLVNFICSYFSYFDLRKNGKSTWDRQIGTVVLYGQVHVSRILFVSIFPIALSIAGIFI
jgi:hypothetical protein